jgi:hypothetical protein
MFRKALQILARIRDLRPYQFRECTYELRGRVVGGAGIEEDVVGELAYGVPESGFEALCSRG